MRFVLRGLAIHVYSQASLVSSQRSGVEAMSDIVGFFLFAFLAVGAVLALSFVANRKGASNQRAAVAAMSPAEKEAQRLSQAQIQESNRLLKEQQRKERERRQLVWQHGEINSQLICPHCQTRGKVRSKPIEKKAGISGGKATAALFTGGISMLATGLSRKETLTQSRCDNCSSTWAF